MAGCLGALTVKGLTNQFVEGFTSPQRGIAASGFLRLLTADWRTPFGVRQCLFQLHSRQALRSEQDSGTRLLDSTQ